MYCHLTLRASGREACPRVHAACPRVRVRRRAGGPDAGNSRGTLLAQVRLRRDRLPLLARGDPTHEASCGRAPGGALRARPARGARAAGAAAGGDAGRPPGRGGRARRRRRRSASCSRSRWWRSGASPSPSARPSSTSRPRCRAPSAGRARAPSSSPPRTPSTSRTPRATTSPSTRRRRRRAGPTLGRPYTFAFTTPTVRLLQTDWSEARGPLRPAGRPAPALQPAGLARGRGSAPVPRLPAPRVQGPGPARATSALPADPAALQAFAAKVARASRERGAVSAACRCVRPRTGTRRPIRPPTTCWSSRPPTCPPPEAWLRVALDESARGLQGRATPGKVQEYTVQLEPTLFVEGFRCRRACDPDDYNPLRSAAAWPCGPSGDAVKAVDVTDAAQPAALVPAARTPEAEAGGAGRGGSATTAPRT